MPQVVKAKVSEVRRLHGLRPGVADVERLQPIGARKEQRRINAPHFGQALHFLQGQAGERQGAPLAILGLLQGDLRPPQIDVTPGEPQQFHLAGAGGQGEHHQGIEGRGGAGLARRQQARAFVVAEIAHPAAGLALARYAAQGRLREPLPGLGSEAQGMAQRTGSKPNTYTMSRKLSGTRCRATSCDVVSYLGIVNVFLVSDRLKSLFGTICGNSMHREPYLTLMPLIVTEGTLRLMT
jgi:hypothetical protein